MIFIFSDRMLSDSMLSSCCQTDSMLSLEKSIVGENTGCKTWLGGTMKYLIIRKSQQLIINGTILSGWVHAGGDC